MKAPVLVDIDITDLAWAAGLFEGEGSISVHRRQGGRYAYPLLQLAMTDEDVVRKFARIVQWGGVYGPFENRTTETHHGGADYWRWATEGAGARELLRLMLPHMGARRRARATSVLLETS